MKGWLGNDIIKRPPTVVLHSAAFKCYVLLMSTGVQGLTVKGARENRI